MGVVAATACASVAVLLSPLGSPRALPAAAATPPYATLLFSRTSITAADQCVRDDRGIARLDTRVAPWLTSLGIRGTGSLVTDDTVENYMSCDHWDSTLFASWTQARRLQSQHGWRFVSHTATYPSNLSALTAEQREAETCGSARRLQAKGLLGGRGLIAYPGAQPAAAVSLHEQHGSRCFAWGRQYGGGGLTTPAAASTFPYWQRTIVLNGGRCNDSSLPCSSIAVRGNSRYVLPSAMIARVRNLRADQWLTVQSYLLVTGRSPAYPTSTIRWDCTSGDPRQHWSNDNERYCYTDFQRIVRALDARSDVTVTDPLTVGVAFGRPASYP